jgi:hypothetical protein
MGYDAPHYAFTDAVCIDHFYMGWRVKSDVIAVGLLNM